MKRLVRLRWNEKAGQFWAVRHRKGISVITPFNLYPLITGRMPREIADRLVSYITGPNEFWSRYPIPTVAMNAPKFYHQQMWRGPIWVNINYPFIEGLLKSGYPSLARELRQRTLNLLIDQIDFYEYYDPHSGENSPKAEPIYGWSAALFVDLAIQATQEETQGVADAR